MRRAFRSSNALVQLERTLYPNSVPLFLCPALLRAPPPPNLSRKQPQHSRKSFTTYGYVRNTASALENVPSSDHAPVEAPPKQQLLPLTCPGCGAPTQIINAEDAGYYNIKRGAVKSYLTGVNKTKAVEEGVFTNVIQQADKELIQTLGLENTELQPQPVEVPTPVCDRCHNLINHHVGVPIYHPSIEAIEATIAESPYKHNHIYHVLDAADFPMSLIPNLQQSLDLPRLRTQNRRSKSSRYHHGRIADVSFIITRSDLLAPKKEQVDTLMPYLVEVLRDALGRSGKNVRLGNVRLVSSKRGWWTKEVKESIWERGGAGWMVGKVNVGKSNLFEVVFPKGRGEEEVNVNQLRSAADKEARKAALTPMEQLLDASDSLKKGEPNPEPELEPEKLDEDLLDTDSLLPPPQKETAFPVMPIVSSLPGTTASPIRVPFGNGKGELIDLPGVARSELDTYVRQEHKLDLVMRSRIVPEKEILKPGQSLLLGGLIRITPTTPDLVFMAHPFVPLKPHVTSTEKAIGIQTGTRESGVPVIITPEAGAKMASAGKFDLKWDITKRAAGPLTSRCAAKLKTSQLPFVVYSTDILIEGVGWVELQAQVRKKRVERSRQRESASEDPFADDAFTEEGPVEREPEFPQVEVFSPEGKFVAARRTMGASFLGGPKPKPANARKSRPRKSMRSVRLSEKARERQRTEAQTEA